MVFVVYIVIEKGNADADNLKNLALPFAKSERKKSLNRRLAAGKLAIDFKNPWNFLANLPAEARAAGEGEAANSSNSEMWCLLEKIRTHFEQNPD